MALLGVEPDAVVGQSLGELRRPTWQALSADDAACTSADVAGRREVHERAR